MIEKTASIYAGQRSTQNGLRQPCRSSTSIAWSLLGETVLDTLKEETFYPHHCEAFLARAVEAAHKSRCFERKWSRLPGSTVRCCFRKTLPAPRPILRD